MKKQIITILLALVAMTGQAQEVFFRTDSALIRGRIVDYSASMGFQMLSAQIDDLFMGEHQVVSAEIHEDGTFEKRLLLHHPIYNWLFTSTENIGKKQVPFYVCPGDTLDITISFNGKDIPDCRYSGGHADDVARLLQVRTEYLDTYGQCLSYSGDIPAYNHWADSVYTARLDEVGKCATEHAFTPFEHQLMLCDVSANFGVSYLAYFSQIQTKIGQEDPSAPYKAGNAVMERLSQANQYEVLRRLPNDDPLMMASMYYPLYMNKLQFAAPLRYPLMVKRGGLTDDSKEEVEVDLNHLKTQGRQMFFADHDVLPIQLLQLQRINEAIGAWMDEGKAEENFNALLPYMSHPQIKEIEKQCFQEMMSMGVAYPLPEGLVADFVREILAMHPNRYIVLDFWAMWCAPCKKEIMDSKNFRQRLRERSDIKFVFLANENNPERKDYQDFVRTNLDGEHNITIDDNRFRQMQDLFGFNAIPFNVTLTPDGRIVQDGLLLRAGEAGYDLFIEVLEEMKAKLNQ
jgi:thiol-disulfide isomerase/thioredoxin